MARGWRWRSAREPRPELRALVAEAFDATPPRDPGLVTTNYVVCATPRSGSTMLCSALHATGMAGIPTEYFEIAIRDALTERWGVSHDLAAYVRELQARRTSSTGVFGVKIHWGQLETLRREVRRTTGRTVEPIAVLAELFPDATYVHLRRADTDRQAISFWTEAYLGWPEGPRAAGQEVPYNFRAISRLKTDVRRGDELWADALAQSGVPVVDVVYEELVAAYQATVSAVVERVTGQVLAPENVPPPGTQRRSAVGTEQLLEQFRRDAKDGRRSPLRDVRDVALDLAVRARTFPVGVAVRRRLDELQRRH